MKTLSNIEVTMAVQAVQQRLDEHDRVVAEVQDALNQLASLTDAFRAITDTVGKRMDEMVERHDGLEHRVALVETRRRGRKPSKIEPPGDRQPSGDASVGVGPHGGGDSGASEP